MATMLPIADGRETRADLVRQLSSTSDRTIRKLGIAGGVTLALVLAIGTLVPIQSGALAPGYVAVENKRKTVQHLDGGIIHAIHVKEGSRVRTGDLLITLDAARAQLNVSVYQGQEDALRAEQASLEAQLLGAQEIDFPSDLMKRTADPRVANIIRSQRAAFAARRDNIGGRKAQLGEQIGMLHEQIGGDHAGSAARSEQLALLENEIADVEKLVAKGFATKPRLLALKRAAAQVRGERAALGAEAAKLRTQQSEVRIQTLQVEREVASAAADALRTIEGQLAEVQEKLSAAKQILERTKIRSPAAGIVVGLRPTTVSGVIQPGEPLMDVVPTTGRLVVSARVAPRDANHLHVGQRADLRFAPSGNMPAIVTDGILQKFSADALTDPRTGDLYFDAEVIVSEASARKLPPELSKPGVPAEVLIKTGSRTAIGYMLAPISRARFRAMRE